MYTEWVMPSNHLILSRPLFLLPSIFPSIRVFSNESAVHIRWPKCWSFSFSISPSNEHPGLISFRMDWLDLLAVQGTLKSLQLIKINEKQKTNKQKRVFSNTTVRKHQFFGAQLSLWSNSHIHTWPLEKPGMLCFIPFRQSFRVLLRCFKCSIQNLSQDLNFGSYFLSLFIIIYLFILIYLFFFTN